MSKSLPISVVCYKKLEDGSEEAIAVFRSIHEAIRWSTKNKIMNGGAVEATAARNTYLPKGKWTKYLNTHLYRFARVEICLELNQNPEIKKDNQTNELDNITAPFVCYKKLEDGSEIVVAKFKGISEACAWSLENNIMGHRALEWTIKHNDYVSNKQRPRKYLNRHLYRFARLEDLT